MCCAVCGRTPFKIQMVYVWQFRERAPLCQCSYMYTVEEAYCRPCAEWMLTMFARLMPREETEA